MSAILKVELILDAGGSHEYEWTGRWPPIPRLLLVRQLVGDRYKLIDPENYLHVDWPEFADANDCELIWFRLERTLGRRAQYRESS